MLLTVKDIVDEAKDTKSVVFVKPENFNFLPGQYIYLTLPDLIKEDTRGPTRDFTLSSSPTQDFLRITTRIRNESGFKQMLKTLKPGDKLEVEGPTGTFILDEREPGKHVLIAGGIGITPFMSMIQYHTDKALKNLNLFLIYSNKTPKEIAFRKTLEELNEVNSCFDMVSTITRPDETGPNWNGLTGRIDDVLINKLLAKWSLDFPAVNFWICGPPPMVNALEDTLGKMGATSSKINSEKFSGY